MSQMADAPKGLSERDGLPDALRILIEQYPRDLWEGHSNFDGLTRFWLSRHLEFRRALAMMQRDAQTAIDDADARELSAQRLSHVGRFFIDALHGHHSIEDHHYFPVMAKTEPRLERGFAILDADHHELHDQLDGLEKHLATLANGPQKDTLGPIETALERFSVFLDRHLTDEEDLIVPIILEHGPVLV